MVNYSRYKARARRTRGRGRKQKGKSRIMQVYFPKTSFTRHIRTPVPTKMKVTLKYVDTQFLNPTTAGLPDQHVYSANGMYDPNVTGAGAQPRGFDQLMALYDHYVVTKSKISVQFNNVGNHASNEANIHWIRIKDGPATNNSYIGNLECSYNTYLCANTTRDYQGCPRLTQTCDMSKFLGRSGVLQDSQLKGSESANPTEQAFYAVGTQGLDAADIGNLTYILVTIIYEAYLIEPKNPAQS